MKEVKKKNIFSLFICDSPANFSVAKRIRDNDVELHEDQQMYSCGSLAPKMGRGGGGGCTDSKFR